MSFKRPQHPPPPVPLLLLLFESGEPNTTRPLCVPGSSCAFVTSPPLGSRNCIFVPGPLLRSHGPINKYPCRPQLGHRFFRGHKVSWPAPHPGLLTRWTAVSNRSWLPSSPARVALTRITQTTQRSWDLNGPNLHSPSGPPESPCQSVAPA